MLCFVVSDELNLHIDSTQRELRKMIAAKQVEIKRRAIEGVERWEECMGFYHKSSCNRLLFIGSHGRRKHH